MGYGNGDGDCDGDGIPGGARLTQPSCSTAIPLKTYFKHSWFDVHSVGGEKEALGPYMPYVSNRHEKEKFEALGCPVDTSRIAAMIQR